jgi:hypothetical protein
LYKKVGQALSPANSEFLRAYRARDFARERSEVASKSSEEGKPNAGTAIKSERAAARSRCTFLFRPVEFFRLRCKYRGAWCKYELRVARHHSAAGQPRKPVAALFVDWFYVTSSFSKWAPSMRDHVLPFLKGPCGKSSHLRFSLHLQYAPVEAGCQAGGGQYFRMCGSDIGS